jgi:beta-alanine--pyruvate transaminase
MHYITPEGIASSTAWPGSGASMPAMASPASSRRSAKLRPARFRLLLQDEPPGREAYAPRLCDFAPEGIDHVFFVNSGSEAVDTALKIARAYHHAAARLAAPS